MMKWIWTSRSSIKNSLLNGTDQEAAAAPARLIAQVDIKGEDVRRQQRTAGLGQVPRDRVEHDGLFGERKRGVSLVSVSQDCTSVLVNDDGNF